MNRPRDLTDKQFFAALARNGFRPRFNPLGYVEIIDGPAKGLNICAFNAGTRKRDMLAYLKREKREWEERRAE